MKISFYIGPALDAPLACVLASRGLTRPVIERPANGTALIDAAQSKLDLASGAYAKIAILDSGHGMPTDVAAHAFELFFTTRERGTGTGLGLSQVYGFAKQSGGTATGWHANRSRVLDGPLDG